MNFKKRTLGFSFFHVFGVQGGVVGWVSRCGGPSGGADGKGQR